MLTCPYPNDKAKLIVREMAEILMFRLTEKKLVTESITLEIGYDRENVDKGGYRGLTQTDRYGRIIPKAAHGTVRFDAPTNLGSTLINESAKLFERITDPALTVRRITINANKVTPDEGIYQVDFFTDTKKLEKEKKLQQAMLGIKNKYGKNAVLKASSYEEGATMRQRNAADRRAVRVREVQMENYKNSKIGRETAQKYGDILEMERPQTEESLRKHPRMTLQNRAKIFSPFSPLRGYDEQLAAEKQRTERVTQAHSDRGRNVRPVRSADAGHEGHDHHSAVLQRGYRPPGGSGGGQLHHPDRKSRPHRPGVPHLAGGRHRGAL